MINFPTPAALLLTTVAVVGIVGPAARAQAPTQPSSQAHVVIPFLANETKPSDLDFEGAECDVDATGSRMACTFQQVFLTTSPVVPDTCFVTTNRYERVFRRDSATHWTSIEGPAGACGILDIATLEDGGGVRWTMELRKQTTKKEAGGSCQPVDAMPDTFGWRHIRRPLPCRFVQPGGLTP
jgi:hypothetical protein